MRVGMGIVVGGLEVRSRVDSLVLKSGIEEGMMMVVAMAVVVVGEGGKICVREGCRLPSLEGGPRKAREAKRSRFGGGAFVYLDGWRGYYGTLSI